jgi:hypothetical protein
MELTAVLVFLIGWLMIFIPSMLEVSRIIGWMIMISCASFGVFI